MDSRRVSPWTSAILILLVWSTVCSAVASGDGPVKSVAKGWSYNDAIPLSCLNRKIESGEHITDENGQLQYIPFHICKETGRPLELLYGVDTTINCTLDFISDSLFHLLEFYVHNDAPLTCRLPTRPLPSLSPPSSTDKGVPDSGPHDLPPPPDSASRPNTGIGADDPLYTPLLVALTGTLQLSHLHVSNHLNLIVHTAHGALSPSTSPPPNTNTPQRRKGAKDGLITAATAYSSPPFPHTDSSNAKLVIGDELTLRFTVRWYGGALPVDGASGTRVSWAGCLYYLAVGAGFGGGVVFAWLRRGKRAGPILAMYGGGGSGKRD
ncbi:hypothetical protein P152DRAFT_513504 [Eremomyces bilateralis CBS 781.70]|uniref:Uncharacterized protein n=1 Tax=Eremomyces bilateralis CBS 781.70 TaxID=1392243 RepID=A0A6G1G5G4_9PEZI|nr:uncharacterized protein P152DRAFT_513504 [Eremomyces bilateralis CBS 781.70]KAF1813242.1 hypothetical protein P152DRAFT_513504 [Eremomyces bilateralis CBS 781.70]